MKLIITLRKIKQRRAIVKHIDNRIGFAFARTRQFVKSLSITVSDINGPRGGIDKQCRIVIQLRSLSPIIITERQSRLLHAVDRAITRASHNLAQRVKRQREKERQSFALQPA